MKVHKKMRTLLLLLCVLVVSFVAFAEEKTAPLDPNATNMSASYPSVEEKLPPFPVAPLSMNDAKVVTKYIQDVNEYLAQTQKYIDGTTNDLNKIIVERNKAIEYANKAINSYNDFIENNRTKQ